MNRDIKRRSGVTSVPFERIDFVTRPAHDWKSTFAVTALLLAIALMFLVSLYPRPGLSQGVELLRVDVPVVGQGYRVSKLIGRGVTNDKNESIGKLDEIVIGHDKSLFAVLQVGGFLGIGSRLVVLPYDSLQIDETGSKIVLPGATKDELKKLAEFKYAA
jgi:PRC-barrel domain protein